jgi:tetratricopeptide (TPR) repeat protein
MAASSGLPFLQEVAKAIRRDEERDPSPENRAALAVLKIIQGHPEAAIPVLREVHNRQPSDPRFLNDLAAASLAVGETTGDPWLVLEAIDSAEQAERLGPSPPARFNLALALERLNLRVRAIVAWERYLDLDSRSAWAQEAEQRLDRLKTAVANAQAGPQLPATPAADLTGFPDNPWARRQLGERVLLSRWAERTLAGKPAEAETALAQAKALATTLSPDGGRLLVVSIAAIREAEQSGDRAQLDLLVHGHQAFGQAFLLNRGERAVEARALIVEAIRNLQAAKTPFELRARVLQAWMATEPDWDELRRIGEAADAGGFAAITAEERRIAAYRMTLEGRMEAGSDVYQESEQRYAALGEGEAAAVISIMRTEQLGGLGRDRESSAELKAALEAGPWMADPWDRYSVYVVAAVAASSRFSRAAVELRLEAADSCNGLPERPLCTVDSWLRVASLTPDADVAEEALQRAEDLLPKAPDSDGKARTEIDLTVARARWLGGDGRAESDREDAAVLYADATKRYEARKLAVSAADARSNRAKLLKSLGHSSEAVAEYRAALRTFRLWDQGDRFRPERSEKRSPAILRDVYENLIGAELDVAGKGSSPAAFLLSEEMRDRLVPRKSVEMRLPTMADLPRFAALVPPGTAVIEYVIFGNRIAAWILAGGHLDHVALTLPDKLEERIGSLAAERNLEAWKYKSGELFRVLLAPVISRLPGGTERLVLIPDSQLYGLPFRALWDPVSHRYLDEDFTVTLTPSAYQLLGAEENQRPIPAEGKPAVLSLGFVSFHPELHLAYLPQAELEAISVLSVYGVQSNLCPASDWSAFRRCAPEADILHLATHATANSNIDQSWVAFPGETVSIERLWRELPDLPKRPVVILSACQSIATARGGEGLGGLARPFLASGARAVVGTLWKLNDQDGVLLFRAFHQAYERTKIEAKALKEAREGMPEWERKPWSWGGVEVINVGSILR